MTTSVLLHSGGRLRWRKTSVSDKLAYRFANQVIELDTTKRVSLGDALPVLNSKGRCVCPAGSSQGDSNRAMA